MSTKHQGRFEGRPTCDNCRFWSQGTPSVPKVEDTGECRFGPPTLWVCDGDIQDAIFPLTFDTDWCGKFEQGFEYVPDILNDEASAGERNAPEASPGDPQQKKEGL